MVFVVVVVVVVLCVDVVVLSSLCFTLCVVFVWVLAVVVADVG